MQVGVADTHFPAESHTFPSPHDCPSDTIARQPPVVLPDEGVQEIVDAGFTASGFVHVSP